MDINEQERKNILGMYKGPVNEDMWDEIFAGKEKNLAKQMNARYASFLYTLTIKEPGVIKSEDKGLMYKLRLLLNEHGISNSITEEEIE